MRVPTARQLQYFLAVTETLSFGRAAELCHVTQSTLSHGLNELESLLGERLFDRGTRHVVLTPIGEEMVEPSRILLEQLENLVHLAKRKREPLSSRLVLGIIPTIAPYLLPKILPAQQKTYPDLDLQLREDITARQLDDLRKGTVDAVLMAFPYDTDGFERMILWSEPFFLASREKPEDMFDYLSLEELKDKNILLLEDGHCLRDHVISSCRLSTKKEQSGIGKSLGATSLQTLIQMVQHGYGSTLLPLMAIDPRNIPQGLHFQRFENPQPQRQIGLIWRKNDPRQDDFKLLGHFIKENKGL